MKNVNAIVAVNSNWGIGKDNKLLYHIKEDMRRFKDFTETNIVIMGRKTFESLPNHKPLANRINVVITNKKYRQFTKKEFPEINAKLYYLPMYEVKRLFRQCDGKDIKESIFVIGGESIYKQLLPYCSRVYMTKIYDDKESDAFFPNLDNDNEWEEHITMKSAEGELCYHFSIYSKKEVNENDCINR